MARILQQYQMVYKVYSLYFHTRRATLILKKRLFGEVKRIGTLGKEMLVMKSSQRISFSRRYPLMNWTSVFVISLVLIFLCVALINILNHEMWRDELQSWLTAKNSSSLANLFYNTRYDGQPTFWCLCLYFLSRFTDNPIVMQIFHLLIATTSIYVFARFSPFTKLQKILFSFGYFPLYEYGTISRNYAFGILFIFGFCAAFRARFKNYLIPFLFLFMLTQTSVYGLIIAISCGSILFFEIIAQGSLLKSPTTLKVQIVAGLSIFILGISSSIFQLIPPTDSGIAVGWTTHFKTWLTLSTIWMSYIPIPDFSYHFWNTNILSSIRLKAFLGCILLGLSIMLLSKKPMALLLYLVGSFGLLAFIYVIFFGFLRHHGHLFILFIASLWISNYYPDQKCEWSFVNNFNSSLSRYKNRIIVLILSANLIAGIFASCVDWVYPFSASKEVAKFITDKGMKNMLMLGHSDTVASGVAGHLNRPIYYPNSDRVGSFIIFDQKRKPMKSDEILEKAKNLMAKKKQDLLLILSYRLNEVPHSVVMVKEFNAGIVADEKYCLYFMSYNKIHDK